jgi:hypothetical protein
MTEIFELVFDFFIRYTGGFILRAYKKEKTDLQTFVQNNWWPCVFVGLAVFFIMLFVLYLGVKISRNS